MATPFTPSLSAPPAQRPAGKTIDEHLGEEIETLSKKEREIIAYLLHHKQRLFTCDVDGGHAGTLISRGIVRQALRANQVFAYDEMPVEVPLEVWRFLRANIDKFPHEGADDDLTPGASTGWNERGAIARAPKLLTSQPPAVCRKPLPVALPVSSAPLHCFTLDRVAATSRTNLRRATRRHYFLPAATCESAGTSRIAACCEKRLRSPSMFERISAHTAARRRSSTLVLRTFRLAWVAR